jgi:hypothetical protein
MKRRAYFMIAHSKHRRGAAKPVRDKATRGQHRWERGGNGVVITGCYWSVTTW